MSLFHRQSVESSNRSTVSSSHGNTGSLANRSSRVPWNDKHWFATIAALTAIAILASVLVGWQVHNSLRELTRRSLRSTLATSVTAVEYWLAERCDDAEQLCSHAEVERICLNVLEADIESIQDASDTASAKLDAQRLKESILHNMPKHQYLGWVLMDLTGTVLSSSHDEFVALTLAIPPETMRRVASGKSTVCRPLANPISTSGDGVLSQQNYAVMLAMAPIRRGVHPIGSLAILLDPMDRFSRILSSAQSGFTDETYAFDRSAMMISRSRFEHQLRAAGLLPTDQQVSSPLNVRVLDPGVDLTAGNELPKDLQKRPMTLMADQATRGATGENIDGYHDYRGVPVVGAWQWLPAYDFGVATEMDVSEAYGPMRILKNSFLGLLAVITICVASLLTLASKMRAGDHGNTQPSSPRRFGRYELIELIGRGGMGSVYRGKHELLQRDVAIKVLESGEATPTSLCRFEREVQLTSKLFHPNTIAIYDYGRNDDGTFYYVMEYVDGISLQQLVQHYGRQPAGRVIGLLTQVCYSLAEAHAQGMVHRDIKPSNILMTARTGFYDLVKVFDFGLVKRMDQETSQLTRSDAITGSPHFMSPEAIRDASNINAQSDLYSVGAVGYFLLTGVPMFQSESNADVWAKHLNEEPLRPDVVVGAPLPEDLQNVLMSCLRKDPAARPRNAQELADALLQCSPTPGWDEAETMRWWQEFFRQRPPAG